MITKEQLAELKQQNLPELYRLIEKNGDSRELLFVLENLGYLPRGFDAKILLPFLQHPNDQVRLWAVKNLGKVSDVPDESIHLTFTSPPYYNARDYSIYKSYNDYLDFL